MHDTPIRPTLGIPDLPAATVHATRAGSQTTPIFALPDLPTSVRVAGEGGGCERATLIFFGVEGLQDCVGGG